MDGMSVGRCWLSITISQRDLARRLSAGNVRLGWRETHPAGGPLLLLGRETKSEPLFAPAFGKPYQTALVVNGRPWTVHMPKVIVMNAATEQMSGALRSAAQNHMAAKTALRSIWFVEEGDLIISPIQLGENFLSYVCRTLGIQRNSFSIIVVHSNHPKDYVLTDRSLADVQLRERIRQHTANWHARSVMPCYYSVGVADLASDIDITVPDCATFALQEGPDLLNRKSHFRQFAAGNGLPIAPGAIARSKQQFAKAVECYLRQTGRVIVKLDNGAGGMGNVTLSTRDSSPTPGARETRQIIGDPRVAASCNTLVVETYYAATHMFYLEYEIDELSRTNFVNSGTIKLAANPDPRAKELIWIGLRLPADIPSNVLPIANTLAIRLVDVAASIGYRGPLNIDAIITTEGRLLFNEINARWGGGTVMHALATRLRKTNNWVASSIRNLPASTFAIALEDLQARNLLYDASTGEGAVLLAVDEHDTGTMECLLVSKTSDRLREYENAMMGNSAAFL